MNKYNELAKKLKALAERGEGGEKYNAQAALERLMKEHGLSMADLEGEETKQYEFKVKNQRLMHQVIVSVKGKDCRVFGYPKNSKVVLIECTEVEAIEIRAKYDFYQRAWDETIEIAYLAFVQKNNIFDPNGKKHEGPLSEQQKKALKIAEGMDAVQYRLSLFGRKSDEE